MCFSPLTDNGGEAPSPAGSKMVIEKSREKESSTQQYYMRLVSSPVRGSEERSLKT